MRALNRYHDRSIDRFSDRPRPAEGDSINYPVCRRRSSWLSKGGNGAANTAAAVNSKGKRGRRARAAYIRGARSVRRRLTGQYIIDKVNPSTKGPSSPSHEYDSAGSSGGGDDDDDGRPKWTADALHSPAARSGQTCERGGCLTVRQVSGQVKAEMHSARCPISRVTLVVCWSGGDGCEASTLTLTRTILALCFFLPSSCSSSPSSSSS